MLRDPKFRELASLPLAPKVLQALSKNGFHSVIEVVGMKLDRFASLCDVSFEQAKANLEQIAAYQNWTRSTLASICKVSELAADSERQAFVLSACEKIDCLLRGGFPVGQLTELCGQPGIGKTQFCLQLCVCVQLPRWCGGLGGQALFIDTEGRFTHQRMYQIASGLVKHHNTVILPAVKHALPATKPEPMSVESVLSRVNYVRVTEGMQLLALCENIEAHLRKMGPVRLIVVDSIAMPFRYAMDNIGRRNCHLAGVAQALLKVAVQLRIAVVLTNQITTKVDGRDEERLIPALGTSWGHICAIRCQLGWQGGVRHFRLTKHPSLPLASAPYCITDDGIIDVAEQ